MSDIDRDRFRIAFFCWIIPAFIGVSATIAFRVSCDPVCPEIGLACVPFGVACFFVGIVHVAMTETGPRKLMVGLLLSNFPLSVICLMIRLQEATSDL
jgi:hypothetical protein